jgi:deoxycytidine triphosphate deaminase
MLLTGKKIIAKHIVDNVGPKSVRAVSYDLRIGTILARQGGLDVISTNAYDLPPQGMVEVIALEKLTLPHNVMGQATVKTSLSDRCVLALGIGLIDPGYDSYISSTLVNFGTQPFRMSHGDIFLRATFHEYDLSGETVKEVHTDFEEYLQDKREKVLTRFSRTFLNLDQTARDAFNVLRNRLLAISAWAALIVATSTAIGSLGILLLGTRWLPPVGSSEVEELRSTNAKLQSEYNEAEKELSDIRQAQKDLLLKLEYQNRKK